MMDKMRLYISILVTVLALLVSGPAMAETARATAEQLNKTWNDAFNRQDAEALAALYGANAIVSPGNGEIVQGRQEIQQLFEGVFDNGMHDHSIEVIRSDRDGNSLYEVARWQVRGRAEDGGEKPVYGGVLVNHFQRDDSGEWQSQSHVWNMQQ